MSSPESILVTHVVLFNHSFQDLGHVGITDSPADMVDLFHTNILLQVCVGQTGAFLLVFAIQGLSFLEYPHVIDLDPAYARVNAKAWKVLERSES